MREVEEKEEKIDVEVSSLAYKKIVYHLIRYPTHKVTGIPIFIKEYLLGHNKQKSRMLFPSFTHP